MVISIDCLKILLTLFAVTSAFLWPSDVCGQWQAVYYTDQLQDTLYSLRHDISYKPIPGYSFLAIDITEASLQNGFDLVAPRRLEAVLVKDGNSCGWYKSFKSSLQCSARDSWLVHRIYTKNVKSYTIYFQSDNEWISKEFKVPRDGYQETSSESLAGWTGVNEAGSGVRSDVIPISKWYVIIERYRKNMKFDFIIGDWTIGNLKTITSAAQHPFLDVLLDRPGNCDTLLSRNIFSSWSTIPSVLSTELIYGRKFSINSLFHLTSDNSNDAEELKMLRKLVDTIIDRYHFYREKGLSKDDVKQQLCELYGKYPSSLKDLSIQLSRFIREKFKDGHFLLQLPKDWDEGSNKVRGPIRLTELNNRIVVGASFNDKYNDLVGAEVLMVQGQPVQDVVERLQEEEWGSSSRKRKVAVSKILMNRPTDSTTIIISSLNGQKKSASIHFGDKVQIPKVFQHQPFEFQILDKDVAYVRFENWEMSHTLSFMNEFTNNTSMRGLVIDLRGNGGGTLEAASVMFSYFIDKPEIFCRSYMLDSRDSGIETMFIKPDRRVARPHLPIVILANELTACASELFILAMKNIERAIVVGSNTTCGSLIPASTFVFPSGIKVRTNAMFNKLYFDAQLEDIGISPDILVPLNDTADLSAYGDKVLNAALTFLNSY